MEMQGAKMETKEIRAAASKRVDVIEMDYALAGVMRFLSLLRAKTERRSRRYKSKYWFARGSDRISRLYVAITSSWLYGFLAKRRARSNEVTADQLWRVMIGRDCLPIALRNCSGSKDGATVRKVNLGTKQKDLTSWYLLKGITVSCGVAKSGTAELWEDGCGGVRAFV